MVWLNVMIFHSYSSQQGWGGGGLSLTISLQYLAQGEGQGGGLRSLPLSGSYILVW
jgi:hypothetical protein